MTVESIVFAVCAVIVLFGGLGVVLSRNPVHSALSLVATLFAIAVLFLNLDAQLLAAVQVIVYTGAIVVLILFVMMLLGVETEDDLETEPLVGQRIFAVLVGVALVGAVLAVLIIGGTSAVTGAQLGHPGARVRHRERPPARSSALHHLRLPARDHRRPAHRRGGRCGRALPPPEGRPAHPGARVHDRSG